MNSSAKHFFSNQFIQGILFIALGWFLLQIKNILVLFFISYIIMAALSPLVDFLKAKKFPKILSIAIPYLGFIAFIVLLIIPLVPFFVSQLQGLFSRFPDYVDQAARISGIRIDTSQINEAITRELQVIGKNAFDLTRKVFGGIFSVLTVLVLSFYLLTEREKIKKSLPFFFGGNAYKAANVLVEVEEKLGAWFRGQIVLSLTIGFITWISLSILGIGFTLPLALLAGILEIVPTIGPIIAAIPAVIIALNISVPLGITVAVIYMAIQILENNFLVPRIMQKAVGLSPVVIILGVIIGGNLLGVLGSLLSIPFIALLTVFWKNRK